MKLLAPWTDEIVERLNEYQEKGYFHPYTCPNRSDHVGEGELTATRNGWICGQCDYTQNWAHGFSLDGPSFAV